ncbi:MAG: adenylate/guanylate cyclase domain-containing protein [Deltaproteobacteria bacterium]|nr:adenylate/guanylate cyclase domain-containing protein [Deltaproteobacteria bacterium]
MSKEPLAVELTRWLLEPAIRQLPLPLLLDALGTRLARSGIRVERLRTSATTKHPEIFVRAILWRAGVGTEMLDRPRTFTQSPAFLESPVARIRSGAERVRCRLQGPDADLSFPLCQELAAEGLTDYVIFPLVFASGERTYASFATDAPSGFSEEALAVFEALLPALSVRVELESQRFALDSLLRVYLGNNAAERVLAGSFLRGTGQPIEAAVWFCDMRGFTSLADQRPAGEMVRILDRFFEAVAGPIAQHGGEILKFVGDAVLAIFPVGREGPADACAKAFTAARVALEGVRALAGKDGLPDLELGIALHLGEVMYGNIGARERLDFTVIGAVVNEVCRVEGLCRTLGPILMTADFARWCPHPVESRGAHALKGVGEPRALFVPA